MILHLIFSEPEPKIADYYYQKGNLPIFEFLPAKDTIYYLGKNYITISLIEQKARLISRKDSSKIFRISSGNQNISKGQSTPEGFFTVQNKSPMAISKQFDNAELFNWIGFNGNVGFHGLKGSGYYGTLGFRPSSHGCVRISREDGQALYQHVSVGTPVIVYSHEPLIEIKFASPKEYNPIRDYFFQGTSQYNSKLMNQRLKNIYRGNALKYNNYKIFADGKYIFRHSTIEIGEPRKVPLKQKMPLNLPDETFLSNDNTNVNKLQIVSDTCKIDFKIFNQTKRNEK